MVNIQLGVEGWGSSEVCVARADYIYPEPNLTFALGVGFTWIRIQYRQTGSAITSPCYPKIKTKLVSFYLVARVDAVLSFVWCSVV